MEEIEKILFGELGEELKKDVLLKGYTSIGVGGKSDYFYIAKSIDDLVKAVATAYKNNIPYFILGGGYNVVPSDRGFRGLIIKNEADNIAFSDGNSQIIVDSGLPLGKLINLAASRELGGLEFLFGVPGTVGGAVYGNAGAFSFEIGDFVKSVILLVPKNGELSVVKKDTSWMNFSYRSSKLKQDFHSEDKPIILTVKLQLVHRRRDEILNLMQVNLKKKKESQPLADKSAGSFFKNAGEKIEEAAGYLLDKSGAKRLRVGNAVVSKKHANFIINQNNATAEEIHELAEKMKAAVDDKFNYLLEEEVEYIGQWD